MAQPAPDILVVDDDQAIRDLVKDILHDRYRVETAEDVLQAADLLREKRFVLLIVDLNLPVLGGVDLITILHAQPALAEMPVLVISAFPDLIERLPAGRVQRILPKPFSIETLQQAVADLVGAPA